MNETKISKHSLFGIQIDAITMDQAIAQVRHWAKQPYSKCHYVVTPNVDHAVLLQEHEGLQAAYQQAALILADGHPLVWASRLVGRPLPERVPGSDLVPQTFTAAQQDGEPLRVYLLGAAPGVAQRAAENMAKRWPQLQTVGTYSPPLGFEQNPDECEKILALIADAQPDLLVVGFGAPKQECWVHAHHTRLQAKVALCVGATIDFLAGEKKRAPQWMQRCGVEWLHRMLSEPRRLVKRYAKDAWIFPQLVWRQWCNRFPVASR